MRLRLRRLLTYYYVFSSLLTPPPPPIKVYQSVLEMDLLGLSNHSYNKESGTTTLMCLLEKFSQVQ